MQTQKQTAGNRKETRVIGRIINLIKFNERVIYPLGMVLKTRDNFLEIVRQTGNKKLKNEKK